MATQWCSFVWMSESWSWIYIAGVQGLADVFLMMSLGSIFWQGPETTFEERDVKGTVFKQLNRWPSWKLTSPPPNALLSRWCSFPPRWDMWSFPGAYVFPEEAAFWEWRSSTAEWGNHGSDGKKWNGLLTGSEYVTMDLPWSFLLGVASLRFIIWEVYPRS